MDHQDSIRIYTNVHIIYLLRMCTVIKMTTRTTIQRTDAKNKKKHISWRVFSLLLFHRLFFDKTVCYLCWLGLSFRDFLSSSFVWFVRESECVWRWYADVKPLCEFAEAKRNAFAIIITKKLKKIHSGSWAERKQHAAHCRYSVLLLSWPPLLLLPPPPLLLTSFVRFEGFSVFLFVFSSSGER